MAERKPQIWIVEEDELLGDITTFRLELLGYDVHWCRSGEAVLKSIADELPDLIIVDSVLPDMGSIQLLDRLSNDQRTSVVPVMVLSIDADLDVVQRAFSAGAKDYLVTPYDPVVLERKIERLLTAVAARH